MIKILNLTFGNPDFLQELYTKEFLVSLSQSQTNYQTPSSQRSLVDEIKSLHKRIHGWDLSKHQIIITNGATQGLAACLNVLNESYIDEDSITSPINIPRIPYFFLLADLANYNHTHITEFHAPISISTLPNNPDFKPNYSSESQIVDCSYMWPSYYTKSVIPTEIFDNTNHQLFIFSFAKAFGLASSRIGWIILKNEKLIKDLEHYIEITTGGPGIESQLNAANVISYNAPDFHKQANLILESRHAQLMEARPILDRYCEVLSDEGMFLWVKNHDNIDIQQALGIKGLTGELFGATNNYLRLNIGCSTEDFNELMRRLDENNLS